MTETLQQLLSQLIDFAPRFFGAIFILIIGFIVAKIISGVVKRLLSKIGIDKFGEKLNEIDIISKSNVNIKISKIAAKFFYYFILLFFLIASADVLAMQAISNLVVDLFNFFPKLLVSFVFLIFGTLLAELLRSILDTTLSSLGITSSRIISTFLFYFLFINVVILAIAQAEINTEFLEQNISIIIGGGVLAFAIGYGLASKDIVANFLSSLYTKDKIKIGDIVELDGEKGQVIELDKTSITVASTGKKIIYPLKHLLKQKVAIYPDDPLVESGD